MALSGASSVAAGLVLEGFESFNTAFQSITRRAKQTFEARDWHAGRRDAAERLDLYEKTLGSIAVQLDRALGELSREESLWASAKPRFASLVAERYDIDRAETFFNSVTRKMLLTVGVNRGVEFFYLHPKTTVPAQRESVYRRYISDRGTKYLVGQILEDFHFWVGYESLERDVELVAQEIDLYVWPLVGTDRLFPIDVARAIFYRNKRAYIVGRIAVDEHVIPVIIPLVNSESGISVDTVLLHESEADIVFSFAYSYFHVDLDRYDALIDFLHSILPGADRAELYTSLGYNRHGKTEFYRDLHRFVHVSREQFVIAPGLEGAVMVVFTLPNYDFVFKVIKDRPCFLRSKNDTPKEITKDQVRRQYDFVSHRDRAGRLVDTQEFENLRFRKKRFSAALMGEFMLAAQDNIAITDEYVILHHLYVQRKVIPLPLYFQREKNPEAIRHVLIDFGYFLKDLAASGVFPCDLFNTWNYGVTHWGRVVLFDYDDVLPIERITFRVKPLPRNEFEENEPEENWIVATQEDFFMDEIDRYSGIPQPLKGVFKSVHADLYTVKFWENLTGKLRNGEIFDVIPYDRNKRFHDRSRTMWDENSHQSGFYKNMFDNLQRQEVQKLLITVVAVIRLVWGATSLAQFVREEISVRVQGDYCTLDGAYEFKNTQDRAALWPIFYPLLNTATIPFADSILIRDAGTDEMLPFESGMNGVSFALNMPPHGSKAIRISYRQRTPMRTMEYILTTTQKWGKPLEHATFKIVVPNSLRLTHISIPYDSLKRRGHVVEYLIHKKAFMPHSNLVVKWERRKQ